MDESDESNKSILQTRMMATGEFEAKKDNRFHNDNSATKVTARGHLEKSTCGIREETIMAWKRVRKPCSSTTILIENKIFRKSTRAQAMVEVYLEALGR